MSFMFNPYPYDDPNAFNVLDPSGLPLSELVEGSGASAAAEAAKAAGALKRAEGWVIAVDGYSTAPLDTFRNLLEQQLALLGIPVTIMAVEELWQEEETLSERLAAENLQEDLEKDPVLLYGKLFSGSYEDLWDLKKLAAAKPCSLAKQSAGHGADAAKRGTAPAGAYRSVQSPLADNRAERGCGP